jgi:PKD repeat protein
MIGVATATRRLVSRAVRNGAFLLAVIACSTVEVASASVIARRVGDGANRAAVVAAVPGPGVAGTPATTGSGPSFDSRISAVAGAAAVLAVTIDIDLNGSVSPSTDGILILRYMFGLTGASLINGALGNGATLTTAAQILQRLNEVRSALDADSNGQVDPLTDGLLFLRHMYGTRGTALVTRATGTGAGRSGASAIDQYIQSLYPTGVGNGGGGNASGVKINQNAAYTNSINVTLNLGMTDPAGVTGYWVSTSASPPSPTATGWVAVTRTTIYSADVPHTLAFTADGNKTVYVFFRNASNVVSQGFSDAIILDRTAPLNGAATATGQIGQVTLNWSGFADGGSGLATSNTYRVVAGTVAVPANCAAGTAVYTGAATSFVHTGLSAGVVNYFRICASDQAGNLSTGATASAGALAAAAPVAKAGPAQTGATNAAIYFDASGSIASVGSIVSYAYSFGDGSSVTSPTGAPVSHVYTAPGTYTMTLTVTNTLGVTATDNAVVTIIAPTAAQGGFSSARQLGGGAIDIGYAVTVDSAGNTVIAGTFQNTINLGGGTLTSAGASDMYIAKYSSTGSHVCSLAIGGSGDERAYAVAVDASGNIFVTGSFQGAVNFGNATLVSSGGGDAFIAKYSGSCSTTALWSRRFGSSTEDTGYGVSVDPSGDVIVSGNFSSNADFGAGFVLTTGPFADVFIAKYAGANGAYLWARTLRGISSADTGRSTGVDSAGNIIVTGTFAQTISDDVQPVVLTSSGGDDAFLIKYSPAGTLLWARSMGGPGADGASGLAVDRGGNITIVGTFAQTIGFNGGSQASAGLSDVFAVKFSPMGNYLWSTRLGSAGVDIGYAVAADRVGNVVIAGAVQNNGQQDILVSKYSSNGAPLWSKTYGSPDANDVGYGVAFDLSGNVMVTGYFQNTANFGILPMPSAGSSDAFLLKLTP